MKVTDLGKQNNYLIHSLLLDVVSGNGTTESES